MIGRIGTCTCLAASLPSSIPMSKPAWAVIKFYFNRILKMLVVSCPVPARDELILTISSSFLSANSRSTNYKRLEMLTSLYRQINLWPTHLIRSEQVSAMSMLAPFQLASCNFRFEDSPRTRSVLGERRLFPRHLPRFLLYPLQLLQIHELVFFEGIIDHNPKPSWTKFWARLFEMSEIAALPAA